MSYIYIKERDILKTYLTFWLAFLPPAMDLPDGKRREGGGEERQCDGYAKMSDTCPRGPLPFDPPLIRLTIMLNHCPLSD